MIQKIKIETMKRAKIIFVGGREVGVSHDEGKVVELLAELFNLNIAEFKDVHYVDNNTFVTTFYDRISMEWDTSKIDADLVFRLVRETIGTVVEETLIIAA